MPYCPETEKYVLDVKEQILTIRLWLLSDMNNRLFCTSIVSFPGNFSGDFVNRLSLSFSNARGRELFCNNFLSS
jgi:hypothetical protein